MGQLQAPDPGELVQGALGSQGSGAAEGWSRRCVCQALDRLEAGRRLPYHTPVGSMPAGEDPSHPTLGHRPHREILGE